MGYPLVHSIHTHTHTQLHHWHIAFFIEINLWERNDARPGLGSHSDLCITIFCSAVICKLLIKYRRGPAISLWLLLKLQIWQWQIGRCRLPHRWRLHIRGRAEGWRGVEICCHPRVQVIWRVWSHITKEFKAQIFSHLNKHIFIFMFDISSHKGGTTAGPIWLARVRQKH